MVEQLLCITYFDSIIGPNTFYCSNPINKTEHPNLKRVLEFNEEEGTFIFSYRRWQTINHIFYVDSELARGGKEFVMISYLLRSSYFRNEIVDVFKYLESKTPILEEYASKLKGDKDFSKILHPSKDRSVSSKLTDEGSEEFQNNFKKLFYNYFKKLSPVSEINALLKTKSSLKKIFILGSRYAGKSTFLKNIEQVQFLNQTNNDLPTRVYDVIIDNIDILTFDCIDRDLECEKCKNYGGCAENAQAYIVMLDVSNEDTFDETKNKFQKIIKRYSTHEKKINPILIIGNKINSKETINVHTIHKAFNVKDLKDSGIKIKYYPINILKDKKGIMTALRWLVKHMI